MHVPLAVDRCAVGEFGFEGADESFGNTVRPRTSRSNPHNEDAHVSDDDTAQNRAGCDQSMHYFIRGTAQIITVATTPRSGPVRMGLHSTPQDWTSGCRDGGQRAQGWFVRLGHCIAVPRSEFCAAAHMRRPEWDGSIRENTAEWALRKFGASGTMDG
jgi:hypothetical protein